MKIRKVAVVILIALSCYGCSKKAEMENIIDFNVEDVQYLSVMVSTPEESESLSVSNQDGILKFIDLLQSIEVQKELNQSVQEITSYYDYTITLADENSFRLIDYQDKMKIIDTKGNTTWYDISTNTWDGLTVLWKAYYTEPSEIITPTVNYSELLLKKPVIYLYPLEATEISVKLDFKGKLSYTYPTYQNEWRVLANPEGTIQNLEDGKTYSYLFWEGVSDVEYDMSKGFVVKGSETTEFLEEKLSYLGLTSKEYNDFIVYWAPSMSENKYNLITFQGTSYTDCAKLTICPEPDSILRVFMVYQPLEEYIELPEQELTQWERNGFSVVEWGGSELYR